MTEDKPAFLDRPAARLVAASVFVLCCALLAYLHRDDWQAGDGVVGAGVAGEGQGSDPAAACIEQRFSEIDAMIEDGVADEAQAALFQATRPGHVPIDHRRWRRGFAAGGMSGRRRMLSAACEKNPEGVPPPFARRSRHRRRVRDDRSWRRTGAGP